MLRIIITIAASAALSACGSDPDQSGNLATQDGNTGQYSIDSESGETTASIETPEGTATMRSGANVPVRLLDGFSLYPGAMVVSNTVVDRGEGSGNLVAMQTDDDPAEVAAFYRKQAEGAGIEIQIEMSVNNSRMIAGEGPDGTFFSLNASRAEDSQTQAQLMIGHKLGG